jgi:Na+-transporting NADH:ubiquinone oxidoreductase subunit C
VREAKPKFDKESLKNVLTVAISVCLVCSVVVSTAAVVLKPQQRQNQIFDERQNILRAAGMLPEGRNVDAAGRTVEELFAEFEVRAVDLNTGTFTDAVDPNTYEPLRAARDPRTSTNLTAQQDIATLGRRENISVVYIRRTPEGDIDRVVLPVRGYGLWGTLFGYLALSGDLQTIAGLGFYSHRETPGLGGEVDNPVWKAQWPGVTLYDADRGPAVRLVKMRSPDGSDQARYEVDALSGATLTTRGVEYMIRFWTGELGFGPFLANLQQSAA